MIRIIPGEFIIYYEDKMHVFKITGSGNKDSNEYQCECCYRRLWVTWEIVT